MLKDNLAALRTLKGYSQEEVAQVAGVSRQAYAKWENGVSVPDVEKCAKLAAFYGTTIDALMNFKASRECAAAPPPPAGKHLFGTVTVGERGQIVIPKEARALFSMEAGCTLVVLGDEKQQGLALMRADAFMNSIDALRAQVEGKRSRA